MDDAYADLSPPVRLAIAYAPKRFRTAFSVLLRFDARFAEIVANTSEPLIGQIKLAWWRDAMAAGTHLRPKGEPMLSALFGFDQPILTGAAVALVDAWEILVAEQHWSASAVQDFAQKRGRALLGAYSQLCDRADLPADIMVQWAIEDLRGRFGNRVPEFAKQDEVLPNARSVRTLTILALSVRQVSGPRLIWHALTGR